MTYTLIKWSFRPEELIGPVHERFTDGQEGERCGPVWARGSVGGRATGSTPFILQDVCSFRHLHIGHDTESSVHRNMQVT